jgi:hypothetical protein
MRVATAEGNIRPMISRNKAAPGNLMNEALKPGDYPIGSLESRAAMRAMIERGNETGIRWTVTIVGHRLEDCKGTWCRGVCGLVSGRFFINRDGEVEEPFQVKSHG